MFSKMIKKKDEPPRKSITLSGTYENINDYDKYLANVKFIFLPC